MKLAELLAIQIEGVQELAVDIQLRLSPRPVADSDWGGLSPAAQVRQLALGEVVLAGDPVHDLQRALAGPPARGAGHERDEIDGLVRAGADVKRLERQAGVTDPRVAVIPVALAADGFRQRGCRGGYDRARGAVGETLQHPRTQPHVLAMGSLVDV